MAQVTIPRWSLYTGVVVLVAALAFSLGGIYTARGDNHEQTFYGCLYAGSLSQVNTTAPPTNCGRGQQVSWNSQGIQGLPGVDGVSGLTTVSASGSATGSGFLDLIFLDCPAGLVPISSGHDFSGTNAGSVTLTGNFAIAANVDNPFGFRGGFDEDLQNEYGWFFEIHRGLAGSLEYTLYLHCAAVQAPAV